jgi:hypothetical protein
MDLNEIKTEFAFHLSASQANNFDATKAGMQAVSVMNNWWPTHNGEERKLTLYWAKLKDKPNIQEVVEPRRWNFGEYKFMSIQKELAGSGCGFKLIEPPIVRARHWMYFTLVRLPLQINKVRERLLKALNYRHLDTGTMAQYWINGWDPKTYSIEKEYEFFNTSQEEWEKKGRGWKLGMDRNCRILKQEKH